MSKIDAGQRRSMFGSLVSYTSTSVDLGVAEQYLKVMMAQVLIVRASPWCRRPLYIGRAAGNSPHMLREDSRKGIES